MGFKGTRSAAIKAIQSGNVQHEARDEVDEKNLLLTGKVSPEDVIKLLNACRGDQYECKDHHSPAVAVKIHIFKPVASLGSGEPKRRWYIKLYFLDPDVWFISVH